MKTFRTFIMILALAGITLSCEKEEDFTKVSVFEKALHDEVNKYRVSQGLDELVLQFVMVKEAQEHARGWANGSITPDNANDDYQQRWHTIEGKLGVTNISNQWPIFDMITTETAAEVVAGWAADSAYNAIMKMDLTQSGPGIGTTSDGRTYILHLFCKYTNP